MSHYPYTDILNSTLRAAVESVIRSTLSAVEEQTGTRLDPAARKNASLIALASFDEEALEGDSENPAYQANSELNAHDDMYSALWNGAALSNQLSRMLKDSTPHCRLAESLERLLSYQAAKCFGSDPEETEFVRQIRLHKHAQELVQALGSIALTMAENSPPSQQLQTIRELSTKALCLITGDDSAMILAMMASSPNTEKTDAVSDCRAAEDKDPA